MVLDLASLPEVYNTIPMDWISHHIRMYLDVPLIAGELEEGAVGNERQ